MSDEHAAVVAQLEEAGLVEQFTDEDGRPALRLIQQGTQGRPPDGDDRRC